MALTVVAAGDAAHRAQFAQLIVEYEASLPLDLRHSTGVASDVLPAAFVAYFEGEAIGCIALTELDAATGIIKRLYVKPASRKLGAARALVTAAIDLARERGYGRVVLDTDRDQLEAAYRLYLALGFTPCEPYAAVEYAHPTYMELRLI